MSWWHPAVRYKGKDVFGSTEAFNAAYAKKYGGEADYIEASVRRHAARSCRWQSKRPDSIDPVKVRDALAAIDTETFYGQVKFDSDGQINSLAAAGLPNGRVASRSCSGPTPSSRARSALLMSK